MALPAQEPGLVISYAYLWHYERRKGQKEGRKDRPCVIVLSVKSVAGKMQVTVAPITHKKPHNVGTAIEIPRAVNQHLHLDFKASWIIIDEVNQFIWPGFDLRPATGKTGAFAYGYLPPRLFGKIKSAMLALVEKRRTKLVSRDQS